MADPEAGTVRQDHPGTPARMSAPRTPSDRRSGAIRSSSAPLAVLVMSADAHRREDWARFFEAQGTRAIRCAGPLATSCALDAHTSCPLHQEADLIFYDEKGATPALERQLDLYGATIPIAFARSHVAPDGSEYPVTSRVHGDVHRLGR